MVLRSIEKIFVTIFSLCCLIATTALTNAQDSEKLVGKRGLEELCDYSTISGFHLGDIGGGSVSAIAEDSQGNIYVGGSFTQAGDEPVSCVAMWDGAEWHDVGGGVHGGLIDIGSGPYQINPRVNAIVIDSLDNVYVAGSFFRAGDSIIYNLAKWDGSMWMEVAETNLFYPFSEMAIDSQDTLYIDGYFFSSARMWDGTSWTDIGCSGINGMTVDTLNNVYLISGASFAVWDGSSCQKFSSVFTIEDSQFDWANARGISVGIDGSVYVIGSFSHAGGVAVHGIAKWEGGEVWSPLGDGFKHDSDNIYPNAVQVMADGRVAAGGEFKNVDGLPVSGIAFWNPLTSTWSAPSEGVDKGIYSFLLASNDDLLISGSFRKAGDIFANRIVRWNGASWSALSESGGKGVNDTVFDLARNEFGQVIIGGAFTAAGNKTASHIALWDGADWQSLGPGTDDIVRAVVVDQEGNLFIGGDFSTAGSLSANHIAMWNGSAWSALGLGLDGPVYDLAVDSENNLYATGAFDQAGSQENVNNIAMWTGAAWEKIGSGLVDQWGNEGVGYTLAVDSHDDIYAAGKNYAGVWNGSSWTLLAGVGGEIYSSAIVDGIYYAGGDFSLMGYGDSSLGRYDGSQWDWVTDIVRTDGRWNGGMVRTILAESLDKLVFGGDFLAVGWGTLPIDANNIAFIHYPNRPEAVGEGAVGSGGSVQSIIRNNDYQLIAAGSFGQFDGVASSNIAFYGIEMDNFFIPLVFK